MVEKGIIPAAGRGSRMLPITKSLPKEMLPLGRKPAIQHVVEEAIASGIKQLCIVIREGKEILREHFLLTPAAYETGEAWSDASLAELAAVTESCELRFVYQEQPLGLGDALLQAREFVGSDPFVMLLPDQFLQSPVPATLQLLQDWQAGPGIWSSLVYVPKSELSFFAGARGLEYAQEDESTTLTISGILTEEETRRTYREMPHEIRGFGRTIYSPEIFTYLGPDYVNPATGEVDLLKTFQEGTKYLAHRGRLLDGEPADVGTLAGYHYYRKRFREREIASS